MASLWSIILPFFMSVLILLQTCFVSINDLQINLNKDILLTITQFTLLKKELWGLVRRIEIWYYHSFLLGAMIIPYNIPQYDTLRNSYGEEKYSVHSLNPLFHITLLKKFHYNFARSSVLFHWLPNYKLTAKFLCKLYNFAVFALTLAGFACLVLYCMHV